MKRFLKKWLKRRLIKIAIETKKPISTHLFEWIGKNTIVGLTETTLEVLAKLFQPHHRIPNE